jgi:exopolyphosphatase/guanosine-5'-triphosphate,3'-diphosphate pyrophosphatase
MKLGAIDIGSNAIRLLIKHVFERRDGPVFIKDALYRVPVRLGEEAFLDGRFSPAKMDDLVRTMQAFRLLMDVQRVEAWRACATSAMRTSANGPELAERVRRETGIGIGIISGEEEASVILHSEFGQHKEENGRHYLYVDVGGGSTELVYLHKGQVRAARSFRIGTLRLLNDVVERETWEAMGEWLVEHRPGAKQAVTAIGSGGNINKLIKMYGRGREGFLSADQLEAAYAHLAGLSLRERVQDLGLKPDRADVIVPAADIFRRVLRHAAIRRVIVPKFGISDGIIRELYLERSGRGSGLR